MDLNLVWKAAAAVVVLGLLGPVWLAVVLAWGERRTRGLAYFGRQRRDRRRFRRWLRFHATVLGPLLRLIARVSPFTFERATFQHGGVSGPRGVCTPESFRDGATYRPTAQDVFVVTQMRSGTTWMQQVVYETLMRGRGDLADRGRALYAVSPWLESVVGVPVGSAPALGDERPSRVIKTHFPVSLCPFSSDARYIYVARHPAACFASCVDFLRDDLGAFGPTMDQAETWFCSDHLMWWGGWPRHVAGWWHRSREAANVLFVRFEEMLEDLPDVVERIASFLDLEPLSEEEVQAVVGKASFDYMRLHKEVFEMYPPHVLAVDSSYFSRGTADRDRDVPDAVRERVTRRCGERVAEAGVPLGRLYPEAGPAPTEGTSVSDAPHGPGGATPSSEPGTRAQG